MPVPEDVWTAFHKAWTAAVGADGYDKAVWKAAEANLLATHRKVLHATQGSTAGDAGDRDLRRDHGDADPAVGASARSDLRWQTNFAADEIMRGWANQYDGSGGHGECAAISAMWYFLHRWRDEGIGPPRMPEALAEVRRMLEILGAFQGRLAIIDAMQKDPQFAIPDVLSPALVEAMGKRIRPANDPRRRHAEDH